MLAMNFNPTFRWPCKSTNVCDMIVQTFNFSQHNRQGFG